MREEECDYECDYGMECQCTEVEPEWEWDEDQGMYICNGCGEMQ